MRTSLTILSLIFFTAPGFYAQIEDITIGSPAWLVEIYFSEAQFAGKTKYFAGEMKEEEYEPTIGEELKGTATISYHEILSENMKAVYAVEVKLNEDIIDFYCYMLETNDGWKIEAVRRFLLPGFIYSTKDSLSQISNLSSSDGELLKIVKLLTSSDAELKNYFQKNVNDFYKLVLYLEDEDEKNIQNLLNELNIDAVFMDDKFPGCIFLQIGAFDKTEMGYFYSGESSSLPKISPNRFIYIEEILPKWYIYKII
ncbi:MAG: hypothetical protein HKM87_03330 [Ignavibacteriaceae bacterium]|nr:hypothetical protein [Ignavibacteriaceae bacterium]